MKHCFIVYDMVNLMEKERDSFIEEMRKGFSKFGYLTSGDNVEIDFIWSRKNYSTQHNHSCSAIVISDDSICKSNSPYKSANGIWPIPYQIDAVIIYGNNAELTPVSIRTPLFAWQRLNYITLIASLIRQNS